MEPTRELDVILDREVEFSKALEQQLALVEKKRLEPAFPDILWLLSHPEVITLGARTSSASNLLEKTSIPIHQITRGGDITYHDPGQVTGYLIFSLQEHERDLRQFLINLELSVIRTLQAALDFEGKKKSMDDLNDFHRVEGKTGVFFKNHKICSIGIACRHWITFHGFSLNFSSNLSNYALMNPCGMEASIMGNLKELTPITRQSFLGLYPAICAQTFSRQVMNDSLEAR